MKRSEMVESINLYLEEYKLPTKDKSIADYILSLCEDAGMLPPYVPSKSDILDEDDWGRIDSINYRWEEE